MDTLYAIGFLGLVWLGFYIVGGVFNLIETFGNKRKDEEINKFKKEIQEQLAGEFARAKQEMDAVIKLKADTIQLARERQIGFPALAKAYDDYFALGDKQIEDYLKNKPHPAFRTADLLKEYNRIKRDALREKKIAEYIVEYYESICPFLVDLKEEIDLPQGDDVKFLEAYSSEEKQDDVINYLSIEEYRKLPSVERNQMALDRFKSRRKSKWLIGRIYERYIGYLYEKQGYGVDFNGIFRGFEDLGRDLICSSEKEVIIIQCKCWSKFRTIYEKHIFQFFGTVFEYRDNNPGRTVRAIFYTSTKLSDLAHRFAKGLNIELREDFPLDSEYPCIKCNVSGATKEKIYHLPFDQQYDKVKIEPHKGEFYCHTVKEAESKGFRRAFRYRGGASS